MSIDEKIKKLEEIASKLEDNNITFEESVKLYESAATLAKELYSEITLAKGKVTQIKQDLEKFKEIDMGI